MSEYLPTGAVAKRLGVKNAAVVRWCRAGRLPGALLLPSGHWRIPLTAVIAVEQTAAQPEHTST